MNLQMLKKSMLAYVSAVKFVWSEIAYPLSIMGKKFMNLRGYRIYGNSVQDGTPTPETPIEIQSVGDLSTKNLFDISKIVGNVDTVNNNDGTLTLKNNYSVSTSTKLSSACPALKVGDTITFRAKSIVSDGSNSYKAIYLSTSKSYWSFNNSYTVTESDLDSILYFYNGTSTTAANVTTTISDIQIELGTTATDYEPYHKYKIPVVARGKNMVTAQQVYSTASNYSECIEDGRNCIRCTSDGKSYAGINFKTNTQYTVRFEAKTVVLSTLEEDGSTEVLFAFTHTDGTRKLIAAKGSKDWTYYEVTSLANKTIASVGMYPYNYKHWIYVNVDTFQIEEGTTATTYEPYREPITTNIFLDEPLRKVGDYADYVDFEKQKVVRNVYQYNLSEISALGSFNDKTTYWYGYWLIREPYPISINKLKIISDKFKCIYPRNADVEDTYLSNDVPPYDSAMYYSVEKKYCPEVETSAEMLDWLRGTNADLFYVLATPIEETVNLPAIPQFKGTTIYEVGTSIKPSGMEAKYC